MLEVAHSRKQEGLSLLDWHFKVDMVVRVHCQGSAEM